MPFCRNFKRAKWKREGSRDYSFPPNRRHAEILRRGRIHLNFLSVLIPFDDLLLLFILLDINLSSISIDSKYIYIYIYNISLCN